MTVCLPDPAKEHTFGRERSPICLLDMPWMPSFCSGNVWTFSYLFLNLYLIHLSTFVYNVCTYTEHICHVFNYLNIFCLNIDSFVITDLTFFCLNIDSCVRLVQLHCVNFLDQMLSNSMVVSLCSCIVSSSMLLLSVVALCSCILCHLCYYCLSEVLSFHLFCRPLKQPFLCWGHTWWLFPMCRQA